MKKSGKAKPAGKARAKSKQGLTANKVIGGTIMTYGWIKDRVQKLIKGKKKAAKSTAKAKKAAPKKQPKKR
jgi:hypothetical protein